MPKRLQETDAAHRFGGDWTSTKLAPRPKVLMNSSHCPLYLFCFAVSSKNPDAKALALRIARHILESD